MESTDICDTDEFKNDPVCQNKKKHCSLLENIFWAIVLVTIAFFVSIWNIFFDRILDRIFGNKRSDLLVGTMAMVSLVVVLILAHFFGVDLTY